MACVPAASEAVLQSALPPETAMAEHPAIVVPLSRKATVPPGVPELPIIAAVKVTPWPTAAVYALESIVADTDAVPVEPDEPPVPVLPPVVPPLEPPVVPPVLPEPPVPVVPVPVVVVVLPLPPTLVEAVAAAMPNFIAASPASAAPT